MITVHKKLPKNNTIIETESNFTAAFEKYKNNSFLPENIKTMECFLELWQIQQREIYSQNNACNNAVKVNEKRRGYRHKL